MFVYFDLKRAKTINCSTLLIGRMDECTIKVRHTPHPIMMYLASAEEYQGFRDNKKYGKHYATVLRPFLAIYFVLA